MSGRWRPALVVAAGILASTWALTPLFRESGWVRDAALLVAAVFLSGGVARMWFRRRRWVPVVQLVTLVLLTGWMFPRPLTPIGPGDRTTLFFGLPTPATAAAWFGLLQDALAVLRSNPAPAPTTVGVTFLLAVSIGLLALAADLIGVTLAMPALAGLPLLAPYLTAVANSDGALHWRHFALPAAIWLLLLADADQSMLRRWRARAAVGGGVGRDVEPWPGQDPPPTVTESGVGPSRWARAVAVGSAALVLAIVTAHLLPQMPVRYLAEGLGRGGQGGGGRVGFSTDLDLRASLSATDQSPVLRYRTDDPSPGPLRVLVSTRFTGDRWDYQPPPAAPTNSPIVPSTGLRDEVSTSQHRISVEETDLDAPHAAAPFAIVDGSMTGAQWAIDRRTGLVVTDRTPASYWLDYTVPEPTQAQLARASASAFRRSIPGGPTNLEVPADDRTHLNAALRGVLRPGDTPYQKALRIQDWLRSSEFTYTLDGVPEPVPAGQPEREEPTLLATFLQEKRGYCTHFATTMVLAARLERIPARMAYGFLPGGRVDDGYEVRQSDAHAWPELYFPEIGWLRFEPTPSQRSGSAPPYALGEQGATDGPSLPSDPATTAGPTAAPEPPDALPGQEDPEAAFNQEGEGAGSARPPWQLVPVVLLGLLLTALVMPLLARLTRRHRLTRAADDGERAEVEWDYLTSALADLGFSPPASGTIGDQRDFYTYAAVLDSAHQRALAQVCETVERARYAPPGAALPGIGAHADLVRRGAGELRSWPRRVRAWWWPRYAVATLRSVVHRPGRDRSDPWGGSAPPPPERPGSSGTTSRTPVGVGAAPGRPPTSAADADLFVPPRPPASDD